MTMLTEAEARKKWCPRFHVATSGGDDATFECDNRPLEYKQDDPTDAKSGWTATGHIAEHARCIASACMAWRWLIREYETPVIAKNSYGDSLSDDQTLDHAPLSVRAKNALLNAEFLSIGAVRRAPDDVLKRIPGLGKISFLEVRRATGDAHPVRNRPSRGYCGAFGRPEL